MKEVKIVRKKQSYGSSEGYKTIRTNLKLCGSDKKVIALTSCIAGEGKSSVALNLAISLAEGGDKVLLIDADLRKSVLLGKVRAERMSKGLSYYLAGQADMEELICGTDIPGFYLALAGPVPPNPTELLGSGRFRSLTEYAREEFDHVIIDTPPLGMVIDSAVIMDQCDGAILVIEADRISCRMEQEVKEQLERTGCPLLGAVLNKFRIRNQGRYGKKYGQYAKYIKYEA